ncbi:hypothetical protein [Halosimplex halobium]|uniref:hypothetical protein n=1 Tax=Halosimplex halobium TaxID=3396618 RepID=UPI003F57CD28
MPTLHCGDRSFDCDRGELLRHEFIEERTDPAFGPGREASGGYGVSALAFGPPESNRSRRDGSESVAPSDDGGWDNRGGDDGGERDERGNDGPQRWTPSPSGDD